jgi:serine/threonine protein kinase
MDRITPCLPVEGWLVFSVNAASKQAIKLIRNNDVMRKAAQRELELLREIARTDPENKKHCVRLLNHFEHRNHVALVFESMQMNLRETLRKFGKHVGINISAVRVYAKQLLVALKVSESLDQQPPARALWCIVGGFADGESSYGHAAHRQPEHRSRRHQARQHPGQRGVQPGGASMHHTSL